MEKCGWSGIASDRKLSINKQRHPCENWLQKSPYLSIYAKKETGRLEIRSFFLGGEIPIFKALVITPNEKTAEFGSLLAVARAEARRREHVDVNPPIRALQFVPELGVYVAVYDGVENINSIQSAEKSR